FFLYSGRFDVFVPFETFVEEIRYLGDIIHYKNFESSGHEGFLSEPLVWKNLR
ncbi:MAG: hypothetical protein H7061_09600, partial [Bdellovibrionaceae bacterium]|nr:hypothetical protein [Bdellovibrio sp.]